MKLMDRLAAMFAKVRREKKFSGFSYRNGGIEQKSYVDELLNWLLVYPDTGFVLCKDFSLIGVLEFRGPDMQSSTPDELIRYNVQVSNLIKSLGTGYTLYIDAQRHFSGGYEHSDVDVPIVQLMEDERRKYYDGMQHFESSYYFVVYREPPMATQQKFLRAFIDDGEKDAGQGAEKDRKVYGDYYRQFGTVMLRMGETLSRIFADVRHLDAAETITYLHNCCSETRHFVCPNYELPLSGYLFEAVHLIGGREMMVGHKHVRIVTVKSTFPLTTHPGLLDRFNSYGCEYRWVSRFICLDKADAKKFQEDMRDRYSQQAKSIFDMMREALTREQNPDNLDQDALRNKGDVEVAEAELDGEYVSYGNYCMTIQVMDYKKERAEEIARKFVEELNSLGFTCMVEDFNSLEAWWGSLPGHPRSNVRNAMVSSLNFCHLAPLTAPWAGQARNDFLGGPVLLYTDTDGYTPFRMSFHVGDVGHTIIVGPSGSGKSVLLNTMEAHFLKYRDSKVFVFDKAASSRCLTLAVGGNFYWLANESRGGELSFQPLARIDDRNERQWALQWIKGFLVQQGMAVGPAEENLIDNALVSLRQYSPDLRTLSQFYEQVQSREVREAIKPLTRRGVYGGLFDNDVERMGQGRWQVFEMEALMNSPAAVAPTLDYLFHRIEDSIGRSYGPSIIVLDECWLFLGNDAFRDKLREYLKDMRKKNTSIIIATQNLADIAAKKDLVTSVINECVTKIYLPNANAGSEQNAALYREFGCNSRQVELIASMTPKRDYYITNMNGNRVFSLALRPAELPFVTATSKQDQVAMDRILAGSSRSDFVREWFAYKGVPEEYAGYARLKGGAAS